MTRRYGRSPIGQRLTCPVPHGHYQTTTLIAALRLKGPQAPWLFGGAMDGELFLAWVKQGLVLCLQPDDVVVMDNLGSHYAPEALAAIEAAGAHALFLPPYSPDWNPIGKAWFMFKNILRRIKARSPEALRRAIRRAWSTLKKSNLAPVFDHCGYGSSKAQPN